MKDKLLAFIRAATPFLTVIFLWRLGNQFWNPAGMLALIPIFYCTFIRPVPWFALFAFIFCFLTDYKADTPLYWTAIFCLCYASRGFQNFIDPTQMDFDGAPIFLVFWGAGLFILMLIHPGFINILKMIWLFIWGAALYMPICGIIKRARNDR